MYYIKYTQIFDEQFTRCCSLLVKNQDLSALLRVVFVHMLHFCCPCFLTVQAVEKLVQGAESGCPTEREKQVILNCTRILTRILPYIFEDQDWRGFFWSTVPGAGRAGVSGHSKGALTFLHTLKAYKHQNMLFFEITLNADYQRALLWLAQSYFERKMLLFVSKIL